MVLVQGIIRLSQLYVTQCGLDDNQEDHFYDSLINVVSKLRKEIVVTAGDFNGQVKRNPENHEDQHGGYGYGVRNKGKRFLSFMQL